MNKASIYFLLLCTLFLVVVHEARAQGTQVFEKEFAPEPYECVPKAHKTYYKKVMDRARQAFEQNLKRSGGQRAMPPLFDWPLRQAEGFDYLGYYAISNFVDQASDTTLLDYNCGMRTYDGHDGTDIRIVPFRWNKMGNDEVEVIAAAPGTIIFRQDGNFDQNCAWGGGTPWNAVFIQHADGTITWYGHLKNGSVTQKDSGDVVAAGEYLGIVGSSGNSTGPHLHLEVYDPMGNLVDPFQGPCNSLNNDTWWNDQVPYFDSGINRLITASQQWTSPACPQQAQIFEKTVFDPGEAITFSVHYRCDLNTNTTQLTAFEPDGDTSTLLNILYQRGGNFFSTNPSALWNNTIPNNAPKGKWIFEAVYNTSTYGTLAYQNEFWVAETCQADRNFVGTHTISRYYQASNTITSTADINNGVHVVYDPENYTILSPGFSAPVGSKLEIRTAGCN